MSALLAALIAVVMCAWWILFVASSAVIWTDLDLFRVIAWLIATPLTLVGQFLLWRALDALTPPP